MDFAYDKYDLFNAPQYVDFNEFIRNDGYGNDNADEFFITHREEDDFFPNDKLSPTAQLLEEQRSSGDSGTLNTPSPQAEKSETVSAPCASNGSEAKAAKHPQQPKKSPEHSNFNVVVDYEEELRLEELARIEKARRIAEYEEIERAKIRAKREESERARREADLEEIKKADTATLQETTLAATTYQALATEAEAQVHKDQQANTEEEVAPGIEVEVPEKHTASSNLKNDELHPVVDDSATHKEVKVPEQEPPTREIAAESSVTAHQVKTNIPHSTAPRTSIKIKTQKNKDGDHKTVHFASQLMGQTSHIPKKLQIKVTIPQPFKFSELRPRKTHDMDKEKDKEEFKFRAKPVPMKVLKSDHLQYNKPPPKVTHPIEMHFASEDRIRERQLKIRKSVPAAPMESREHIHHYHHQPRSALSTSRSTIESAVSTEKLAAATGTVPRSLKTPSKTGIRARSLSADRNKPIQMQPFSFEERDKELMRKKEEKIRNAIMDEMKHKDFHAQPVPKFAKRMPPKQPAPVTAIKPFKLKSDERGTAYQQEFQRKVEEEKHVLKQQAEFVAQPNTVIYRKPFEPERSNIPLAEPLDHVLNSDKRADERSRYDQMIKEKEAKLEELRKHEQQLKEEQEKKMSATLRQMCVHKAKPAPRNRCFELRASERPLTEPKSPAFELLPSQRRSKCPENKENVK